MSESNTKTAIVTAIITGIFTVLAGLATYWVTTKEPELAFTVAGGPSLPAINGTKRIFVVEVRNSGKKEIAQALVQLALPGGELSEVASEASPGVTLTEEKSYKQIALRADLLNPGDVVKVSFLTSLSSPEAEPKVVVRAPGVTATDQSKKKHGLFSEDSPRNLFPLLATALAAVLSSFTLLRSNFTRHFGMPLLSGSLHQSEMCAFVCDSCQLHNEANMLRFGGSEITYRGSADFILSQARGAAPADRVKYEVALQALLLGRGISTATVATIHFAIEEVKGTKFSDAEVEAIQELAIDEGDKPVVWRQVVEVFVQSKLKGS